MGCPECGKEHSILEAKNRAEINRLAKIETQRKAKEKVENQWKNKIHNIKNGIISEEVMWFNDFFGFNFTNLTMSNGVKIHGKFNFKLDDSHYPLTYAEIQADEGCLTKAYFLIDHVFNTFPNDNILDDISVPF